MQHRSRLEQGTGNLATQRRTGESSAQAAPRSRGLHVLQVITDPDRRGAQVFAHELGAALVRRGLSVSTVALAASSRSDALPVPALGAARLSPATLRALRRRMQHTDVAVGFGSTTLPACTLAGVGLRIPFVYRSIGELGYWANTPARRARVRIALRRAQAIVILWPQAAEELVQRFGVERHRLRVIPRGVPATSFPPVDARARPQARVRLGLDEHLPTLTVVGALSPEKNVSAAIRVLSVLQGHQLLVVGDGPLRGPLESLAGEVAPRRVVFTGTVTDLRPIFAASNVVLLMSRSEGMPGVLIEAGLSGLPTVATDVGAVRQVVRAGETGEVVAPDDEDGLESAVRRALSRQEAYGRAARRRCLTRFEIGTVAEAWERLLTDVVRRGIPSSQHPGDIRND